MRRNRRNINREFDESLIKNSRTYLHYYNRLLELAISIFEWKNLPIEIDERYLELILCEYGYCAFFEDKELEEYLVTRVALGGKLDIYRRPINYRAFANNGYNRKLNNENSVIIYNNYLHTNTAFELQKFAMQLYDLDTSLTVNAKAQKTPIMISCDENQRLSLKNAYMQFEGNMPVIYTNKNLNPNSISVMKTDAPYVADKLNELKREIWSEALTFLGINNVNVNKKERLITNEVENNQGSIVSSRFSRLEQRRQAVKRINKMYGLNIEVNFRENNYDSNSDVVKDNANNDVK